MNITKTKIYFLLVSMTLCRNLFATKRLIKHIQGINLVSKIQYQELSDFFDLYVELLNWLMAPEPLSFPDINDLVDLVYAIKDCSQTQIQGTLSQYHTQQADTLVIFKKFHLWLQNPRNKEKLIEDLEKFLSALSEKRQQKLNAIQLGSHQTKHEKIQIEKLLFLYFLASQRNTSASESNQFEALFDLLNTAEELLYLLLMGDEIEEQKPSLKRKNKLAQECCNLMKNYHENQPDALKPSALRELIKNMLGLFLRTKYQGFTELL
jgi:hypothetical protein